MSDFAGFPKDFFKFFKELKRNNDRAWFEENKERYREIVLGSMSDFITAIAPRLAKISLHYVADPRPNRGSMFRIYRDIRFSKDKRPFKEHGACQFRHQRGRDAHAPGYYVHLAPDEVFFGGGIWKPPAPELERIRRAIADDPAAWRRVTGNKRLKEAFGAVVGDGLKRPPRGFDAEHPLIEEIKRQTHFVRRRVSPAEAQSPDFVEKVAAGFRAATPLMKFVCKSLDVPF